LKEGEEERRENQSSTLFLFNKNEERKEEVAEKGKGDKTQIILISF
jgi:hypothetical protein